VLKNTVNGIETMLRLGEEVARFFDARSRPSAQSGAGH
jgi:hypothetical protein